MEKRVTPETAGEAARGNTLPSIEKEECCTRNNTRSSKRQSTPHHREESYTRSSRRGSKGNRDNPLPTMEATQYQTGGVLQTLLLSSCSHAQMSTQPFSG
ncbi:hypothetical protein Pmani_040021 [Petrolisthes manimaculis]|uniref:Uncharacterized protein n=1 Tax=Petrolisthes manimaculis TaxID=1843537 RepID=A0AAE1NBD6_9EUCA|nr:hypothetical protein Pmani_040021 [Petrolisthes manimaculis]